MEQRRKGSSALAREPTGVEATGATEGEVDVAGARVPHGGEGPEGVADRKRKRGMEDGDGDGDGDNDGDNDGEDEGGEQVGAAGATDGADIPFPHLQKPWWRQMLSQEEEAELKNRQAAEALAREREAVEALMRDKREGTTTGHHHHVLLIIESNEWGSMLYAIPLSAIDEDQAGLLHRAHHQWAPFFDEDKRLKRLLGCGDDEDCGGGDEGDGSGDRDADNESESANGGGPTDSGDDREGPVSRDVAERGKWARYRENFGRLDDARLVRYIYCYDNSAQEE
jgi:hypothetical protein